MKHFIVAALSAFALSSLSLSACHSGGKPANSNPADTINQVSADGKSIHAGAGPRVLRQAAESTKALVSSYLKLKNALTQDNSEAAAAAGVALAEGFGNFNQSELTDAQKASFKDITDDAREMAEHIGKSGDKLAHQREHFDMLSTDMYDLVKLFGAGQSLFVDHCPMYNDKKGAIWLSETREIQNPYMGKGMASCGAVKEELK